METLTRRTMITATAVAALAPVPLAAAKADADAEIIRLYAAYVTAEEREMALYATWDEARGKAVHAAKITENTDATLGTDDRFSAASLDPSSDEGPPEPCEPGKAREGR